MFDIITGGNRYLDVIALPAEAATAPGGSASVDVSTVIAFDTGRYETCLFADHRSIDDGPTSNVVATYPDLNAAAAGHRAIVNAITFALNADHPYPEV